jgi:hypothetical protein
MAPRKSKKPGRPLTQAERDAIDEEIFADGGYEIWDENGKRLVMQGDGTFVPITGSKAQEIVKKKRKRKPKATGG